MKLVVFGDSNAAGSEACNDWEYGAPHNKLYAYGALVAKELNIEYENLAEGGATNMEIVNDVFNWINSNADQIKDTLLLIGWTEPGRVILNGSLSLGKPTSSNTRAHIQRLLTLRLQGLAYLRMTPVLAKMWHLKASTQDPHMSKLFTTLESFDPTHEFCRVFHESIVNSDETKLTHLLSIIALDQHLQKLNANYLAFPALPLVLPSYLDWYYSLLAPKNNITGNDYIEVTEGTKERFEYINIFSRYGKAAGGHLKASAHCVVAQWLVSELKQRQII